jgi:hypothetical protein
MWGTSKAKRVLVSLAEAGEPPPNGKGNQVTSNKYKILKNYFFLFFQIKIIVIVLIVRYGELNHS